MISPSGGGHPLGRGGVSLSEDTHRKTLTSSFSNNILLLISGNKSKRLPGIYREELVKQRPLSDFGQKEQQAIRHCTERQVGTMFKMPSSL